MLLYNYEMFSLAADQAGFCFGCRELAILFCNLFKLVKDLGFVVGLMKMFIGVPSFGYPFFEPRKIHILCLDSFHGLLNVWIET